MEVDRTDKSNSGEALPNLRRSVDDASHTSERDITTVDDLSSSASPTNIPLVSEQEQAATVTSITNTMASSAANDNGRHVRPKPTPKFGKRWTWKKPEGKPKRPLSAYNLFFANMRQTLLKEKQSDSGIGFSNLAKKVSEKWRTIPQDEKDRFESEANALKSKYMTELHSWESQKKVTETAMPSKNATISDQLKKGKRPYIDKTIVIQPLQEVVCDKMDDKTTCEIVDTKPFVTTKHSVNRFNFKPDMVVSKEPGRVDYDLSETTSIAIEMTELQRGIAVVTEAFTELGKSIALKIASFPFVDVVLAISKAIPYRDFTMSNKIRPLAVDISTLEGKHIVIEHVRLLCNVSPRRRQVRFLIHCPVAYGPTRSSLSIQHAELRHAMSLHCDAPLLLITSLYPYLEPDEDTGIAGRVLHILNHENKRSYGICVESLAYAALFQAYQDMTKEFQHVKGGNVIVGSCKVVSVISKGNDGDDIVRLSNSPDRMKETSERSVGVQGMLPAKNSTTSHDSRANYSSNGTSNFVEHLLLGTSDKEFSNSGCPHLYTTEQERK
jgi:HMG-box domain